MKYQLVACCLLLVARCKHAFRIRATSYQLPSTSSGRGFTILLAALVATLVLALGISVFSIAQKQIILSSLGRSSQYAFYSADTAAECALYWDVRFARFPTSTLATVPNITCDSEDITITVSDVGGSIVSEFDFEPNGYCANVAVIKDPTDGSTRVEADGFSTECSEIDTSNRVLQRSVELSY